MILLTACNQNEPEIWQSGDDHFMLGIGRHMLSDYEIFDVTEIYCYDRVIKCDTPLWYSTVSFGIYHDEVNDFYIVGTSYIQYTLDGMWYYVSPTAESFDMRNPYSDGYDLRFSIEDGRVKYMKLNYKFMCLTQAYFYTPIPDEISCDEFFMERGYVDFKDDIVFTPEVNYTVGEWYLSDDLFFINERLGLESNIIFEDFIANITDLDKLE